ncbi:hypothetical protein JP75_07720 [Devosia riboflavina]|uniref:Uncharacterized protein n=1 Tax=Devosia riboflavina TaxID=46914 RepID=A0A087M3I2_9HYPH|nr:hypothetical protein [Devosia riboflavina]KFL31435.1 hypothetical protein JP75_07720 [Devosia riboflavina]
MLSIRRTSRNRGGNAYTETRTNAWAGMLGFLTGRGYSSVAIAEVLGEGTTSETVRSMWTKWGFRGRGLKSREVSLQVPFRERERAHIAARAAQHDLSPEEYCRRIMLCASMPRDRYDEIVPADQFE